MLRNCSCKKIDLKIDKIDLKDILYLLGFQSVMIKNESLIFKCLSSFIRILTKNMQIKSLITSIQES